jgi:hypothetical protein
MQYISAFLLLSILLGLGSNLCSVPLVRAGAINTKTGDGNVAARNRIRGDNGNFNETIAMERLELPAGFNFSAPGLNIISENVGEMIAFGDSELDKIPGAKVIWVAGDGKLFCETSDISPLATHVNWIAYVLSGYGDDKWCCQIEADKCTRMMFNYSAASDICAPWTPDKPQCLRCKDAGAAVKRIYKECTNKVTKQTGGYVRYASLLANCRLMLTLYCSQWAYDPSLSYYTLDVNVYHT